MHSLVVRKQTGSSETSPGSLERSLKASNLICLVCGAPATGFNFSAITCMCCKAFFRRNALFGLESYQCRYLTESCTMNIRTRRDCSFCRLKKCFDVGMNKNSILTEEVKRLKRERLHANRQLRLMQESKPSRSNVLDDLREIFNAYEEHCRLPIRTFEKREYELSFHQPVKSRIKLQHYLELYEIHRTSLLTFFQHVPEFQQMSIDEQKGLLSNHIRYLMRINSIETMDDSFPLWGPVRVLLDTVYGKSLIETIAARFRHFRVHLNDSHCIQLLLIILLFSTSIHSTENLNALGIYQIQEKYTQILWTYLIQRYGELAAYRKFAFIIHQCLYLQTVDHTMENLRQEFMAVHAIKEL